MLAPATAPPGARTCLRPVSLPQAPSVPCRRPPTGQLVCLALVSVHGQLRRRRADKVRAVPGGGPASLGLLRAAEARSLPGLQHSLLPRCQEERRLLRGPHPLVLPGAAARPVQPPLLRPAVLPDVLLVQPVNHVGRFQGTKGTSSLPAQPAGRPHRAACEQDGSQDTKHHAGLLDPTPMHVCLRLCVRVRERDLRVRVALGCTDTVWRGGAGPRDTGHTGQQAALTPRANPELRVLVVEGRPGKKQLLPRTPAGSHLEAPFWGGISSGLRPQARPAPVAASLHRDRGPGGGAGLHPGGGPGSGNGENAAPSQWCFRPSQTHLLEERIFLCAVFSFSVICKRMFPV